MRYESEVVGWQKYNGTTEDPRGNLVDSWATAIDLGIYAFNPGGSVEPPLPGFTRVVTTPTIYVPSTKILSPRDRVTVRGKLFEVDGETSDFRNPYDSQMNGNSVNLKAVTG